MDLPTNTPQTLIFIPLFSTARAWDVRLLDESGKIRSEQILDRGQVVKNNLPLVAALARTSRPEIARLPLIFHRHIIRMPNTRLPDCSRRSFQTIRWRWREINLLYLSSERAANLTVGQVNALVAWLQSGGHLVLGVEQLTDVNATLWLRELLPCELNSTVTLTSHSALEEWAKSESSISPNAPLQLRSIPAPASPNKSPNPTVSAQMQSRRASAASIPRVTRGCLATQKNPGSRILDFAAAPLLVATGSLYAMELYLIGDASAPLALEGVRGRGKITVLMFDPEHEPFVSWKNRGWLWAGLAGIPASAFQTPYANIRASRLSSDGIFGAMIDTKQVRKLPLGWLLALLAAYLVVIGPLDQYWLKKINRQMLTWVTFPCYVAIFSGLIYYIGFHLRAGEVGME